jgi:hypothetical protein
MYNALAELRFVEAIADEFVRENVGMVVCMPHWSTIGAVAAAAAPKVGAITSSLPVVSVDGTRASLVGWEKLDLIGCYGEQCMEAFRLIGIPESRLRLLGSVVMDRAIRLTRDDVLARNAGLRNFLTGAGPAVLVATSGIDPNEIVWFRELCRIMKEIPDSRILLRPHPSFGSDSYEPFISEAGGTGRCAIFTQPRIHDLIRLSDVVITDYSTAGAEAVLMGKLLLTVNCTGKRYPANNYDEHGVALMAQSPGQIEGCMRALLFDDETRRRLEQKRTQFARRYNWMNDGCAAERYIDALIDFRSRASHASPEETACRTAPASALLPARAQSSVS